MWRGTSFSPSDIRVTIHQVKLKVKHLPPIGRLAAILGTLVFVYLLYRLGVYLFITDLSYHTGMSMTFDATSSSYYRIIVIVLTHRLLCRSIMFVIDL